MANTLVIGDMRHDIEIQAKTLVRDEYGSETVVFVSFLNLKASVKSLSGIKGVSSEEIFTTSKKIFLIYFREGIKSDMVIIFKNERYAIDSIDEPEFRKSLAITCSLINN